MSAGVVYANETASVAMPTGEVVTIHRGDHYPTDHPVVLRCPGFFTTDARVGMVDADVEQMTAAPGERRTVRRG